MALGTNGLTVIAKLSMLDVSWIPGSPLVKFSSYYAQYHLTVVV